MPKLEIAVTTLQDARHAEQGGADSIEISENLSAGGLTPSIALVEQIRAAVRLDVYVIVRPQARDFVYTPAEIDQILNDTRRLALTGITGIVFGACTPDNRLNIALIEQVKAAAAPLPVTVHRALDQSRQPETALEQLKGVVPRILTSGPAANTWEGREGLRRWVNDYGEHFSFVASGGLKRETLHEYASYVQAHEYHFGGAARTNDAVTIENVRLLRRIITGD